jgi:hypothetical protein
MNIAGTFESKANARAVWAAAEPFTLWGYFCREVAAALSVAELDYFGSYLAVRAAPLGAADPAVAVSCFRSLPAEPIQTSLNRAWSRLTPTEVDQLAHQAIGQACDREFGALAVTQSAVEVVQLLDAMVDQLDTRSRPLSAGNQAVPLPDAPWPRLWRRLNTLREYRGEGHAAALVLSGLDLVEVEVLMAAWAGARIDAPRLMATRAIDEAAQRHARTRLQGQGLLDDHGGITDLGRQCRSDIEDQTDAAASQPWLAIDPADVERIWRFCHDASEQLVTSGQMGAVTPVGAPWPPPWPASSPAE